MEGLKKKGGKQLFREDDLVVYGTRGVCRVKAIGNMKTPGTAEERLYYTLEPIFIKNSVIYTPVDNDKVIIRSVISKDKAMSLIEEIPLMETIGVADDKKRETIYHESMNKCDCRETMKVIKTLYQRKQERAAIGKKTTSLDDRYLHLAQDNLFSELSIPLNISKSEVEAVIISKVELLEWN